MNMDMLKQQILAMAALKGDSIGSMIYSFIILMIFEHLFKFVPLIEAFIKLKINHYFEKATTTISSVADLKIETKKEKMSSIMFTRVYTTGHVQESSNNSQDIQETILYEKADCILEHVVNLEKSKFITFNKMFYVKHHDEIQIVFDKILFKMIELMENDKGIQRVQFEIYSYDYSLSQLHEWINKILADSKRTKQNKLGNQLYYFNENIKTSFFSNYSDASVPQNIPFTLTKFFTNKTLNNVYGEAFDVVKNRVNFFMNNEDWYKLKGVPYTLGIMVSGPPGTGKTSCIKAIANVTKRHIINISLNKMTTKTQLKNLFYDDRIMVEKSLNQFEYLTIPCEKRIYVIEDIDCLTDVVIDRSLKKQIVKKDKKKEKEEVQVADAINLSFLLNLFDGVLETPGRILIFSSNFPERIDKALLRPGRIDVNITFGHCTLATMIDIICANFDMKREELKEMDLASDEYTPAEIGQILFNNIDNKKEGIRLLLKENIEMTRTKYNIPKVIQQVYQEPIEEEEEVKIETQLKQILPKSGFTPINEEIVSVLEVDQLSKESLVTQTKKSKTKPITILDVEWNGLKDVTPFQSGEIDTIIQSMTNSRADDSYQKSNLANHIANRMD